MLPEYAQQQGMNPSPPFASNSTPQMAVSAFTVDSHLALRTLSSTCSQSELPKDSLIPTFAAPETRISQLVHLPSASSVKSTSSTAEPNCTLLPLHPPTGAIGTSLPVMQSSPSETTNSTLPFPLFMKSSAERRILYTPG